MSAKRQSDTIAPPDPDREPMKANIYDRIAMVNSQLTPLFPYFDEGAIVPAVACFRGGPDVNYGRFQHFNAVDEVVIQFGNQGEERGMPGVVFVGPKLHMVQGGLQNFSDPNALTVVSITQRQMIGKEQREEVRFVCEKCDRRLYVRTLDATPPRRGSQAAKLGDHPVFPSIALSEAAAAEFNADANKRKCEHCGHENAPFPVKAWGWEEPVRRNEISRIAAAALKDFIQNAPAAGKAGQAG